MKKRILSLFTALILVILSFPAVSFADGETVEEMTALGFGYEKKITSVEPLFLLDFEDFTLGPGGMTGFSSVLNGEPYPAGGPLDNSAAAFDAYNKISMNMPEKLTTGRYVLSFDIKRNNSATNPAYIRANADIAGATEKNLFALRGTTIGRVNNSWKYYGAAYAANTWAHVMIYMDFDTGKIYYYVNNKEATTDSGMVDLQGFQFRIEGNSGTIRYLDNLAMFELTNDMRAELKNLGIAMPAEYDRDIDVNIYSKYSGNIFNDFNDIEMNIDISNKLEEELEYDIEYRIEDYDFDIVYEEKIEGCKVGALGAVQHTLKPTVDRYDIYTLYVTVTPKKEGLAPVSDDREFSMIHTPTFGYKNPYFGTCTHPGRDRTNWEEIDRAVQLSGLGYLRTDYGWSTYETSKGQYTGRGEAQKKTKNFYQDMKNAGFTHIAIFNPNNGIYGGWKARAESEEAMLALEKAAENFARQYKGIIDVIELGNEINHNSVDSITPEMYAKHCQAAYRGLKKGNPDCTVLSMGFSRNASDYIYRTLKTPGGQCWDIVALHIYQGQGSPESMRWDEQTIHTKEVLAAAGYPDMKIWVTEGNTSMHVSYSTEPQHAANLIRQLVQTKAFNVVEKFMMYQIQVDEYTPTENEHAFGALRGRTMKNANAAKPTFLALSNYNAMTENAEVDYAEELEGRDIWLARYKKPDGKNVLIMYADRKCDLLSLDLGAQSGTLYDISGNPTSLASADGKYTFSVSDQPIYFEYTGDKLEVLEENIISLDKDMIELADNGSDEFILTLPEGAEIEAAGRSTMTVLSKTDGNQAAVKIVANELPERIYVAGRGYRAGMYTEHYMDHGTQIYRDYVDVYVKKDGAVHSLIRLPVEYAYKSADVMMTVKPYDDTNAKHWQGVLEVTNNKSQPISGVIKMATPQAMAAQIPEMVIENLGAKETRTLKFNIPTFVSGKSNLYSGIFTLSDGEEISFALGDDPRTKEYKKRANTNIKNLEKVKGEAPVIDGVINEAEWANYKIVDFDKSQVSYGADEGLVIDGVVTKATFGEDADYGGMADFSGTVYSSWDDKYLYLAAVVYDDVHWNNEPETRAFGKDCFILTTKPTTTQRHDTSIDIFLSNYYKHESYKDYNFTFNEDKGAIFLNWSPTVGARNASKLPQSEDGSQAKVVRKDNVTIYEARLPWDEFASQKTQDMKQMYISYGLRDYDGDRDKSWSYARWFVLTNTKE